ncbi:MAG: hypothetical protein GY707_05655 [Desulfobacteraceae bacterium]|nr:hypothetical protein [Desulfobacteraceae bacterium]
MSDLTIEDYLENIREAEARIDDAQGDLTEAERALETFCEENDLELPNDE